MTAAAPAWLAAERSGTFAVGPGSGWDPLAARELDEIGGPAAEPGAPAGVVVDHPERVKACQRGELAARMVTVACELACLVRDEDRDAVGEFLARLTPVPLPLEVRALLVVLAAMVPDDATTDQLLAWVTFDEFGQLLPGAVPVLQRREKAPVVEPCGTLAAYRRHKARGEPAEECGCAAAARAAWAEANRNRRAKEKRDAAA